MTYLYEKERKKIVDAAEKKVVASVTKVRETLEAKLDAEKKRRRGEAKDLKRRLLISEVNKKKVEGKVDALKKRIEETELLLRLHSELNEPLIDVVSDHIREGLTLRAACRLSHVSYAKMQKWLAEAKMPNAPSLLQHLDVRIEEALGLNEKMWVEKVKSAAEDDIIELGDGCTFKRGDGKVAMAMLAVQHPKDYSPRHVIVTEEVKIEDDFSTMTDEELAIHRQHEAMIAARQKRLENAARVRELAPGPNQEETAIPVDGEEVAQ